MADLIGIERRNEAIYAHSIVFARQTNLSVNSQIVWPFKGGRKVFLLPEKCYKPVERQFDLNENRSNKLLGDFYPMDIYIYSIKWMLNEGKCTGKMFLVINERRRCVMPISSNGNSNSRAIVSCRLSII